jgi:hypothetical protein
MSERRLPLIAMRRVLFAAPSGADKTVDALMVTIVNFPSAAKPLALNISYDRRGIRFTRMAARLYA